MFAPWLTVDIWAASLEPVEDLHVRQRRRFAELVAYARRHSPVYRELVTHLPDHEIELANLPPTDKATLMPRFDEWVTDPRLSYQAVARFSGERGHIGQLFEGRYAVWKTSGTTGEMGLFVHDPFALAVYDTLFAARAWPAMATATATLKLTQRGGRMACIVASEDHFAGISSWRHQAHTYPWLAPMMRDFSVMTPLHELCQELEAWDPGQIVAYPSVLSLLAREQIAGRLNLRPAILIGGGETLDAEGKALIENAFDCHLYDVYACSECDYVAFGCEHGWLHINADWVILEPIEEDGSPTPLGKPSSSALLTNLANKVQPIIRYDLKDSITVKPEPCRCGSHLPAIRVEGRVNQYLRLADLNGRIIDLLPLAVGTLLEEIPGLRRFQVVQTGRRMLQVRCEPAPGVDVAGLYRRVLADFSEYLESQGLAGVEVEIAPEAPKTDPRSGKLQQVVCAFDDAAASSH